MDPDKFKALNKRVKRASRLAGHEEHHEDIAQEVWLRRLTGKGLRQRVYLSTLDVITSLYGNPRNKDFELNQAGLKQDIQPETLGTPATQDGDFERLIETLEGEERAVTLLFLHWELTFEEIGHLYGCSMHKIVAIYLTALGKLKDVLTREE